MGLVWSNDGKKFTITIDSVLGGISRGFFAERDDQFHISIAINPYEAMGGTLPKRPPGFLLPTGYKKFSGTVVTTKPLWIIKSPKLNGNSSPFVYYYENNGKFGAFTDAVVDGGTMKTADLATTPNTLPIAITNGNGSGGAYYNNYVYCTVSDDVSRYGPINSATGLDTSNGMAEDVWTGATLGSQTALTDTTYPLSLPNHPMHLHPHDNRLYFGDFKSGQGMIHYIETKTTTYEGDTNNGSLYNALDLPFGYAPTDIESYGKYLVVSAIQTTNDYTNQGNASLFFWNTDVYRDSYDFEVPLLDPLATSLINSNGILRIFSGGAAGGVRLSKYLGGYSVETELFWEEGTPPLAGAVEAMGEAIVFPINITYPETGVGIFTWGGRGAPFEPVLHCIGQCSDTAQSLTRAYSLAQIVQNAHYEAPKFILGWYRESTTGGLDEYSQTKGVALYRSNFYKIGRSFQITKMKLNFGQAIASNNTLVPKFFFDEMDASSTKTLTTINSTNAPSAISYTYRDELDACIGDHSFFLELRWSGSAVLPVQLPIIIEGKLLEDNEPYNT